MKIATTTVTQTANEVLGTKEKKLYYLIVENTTGRKLVINVGEKTHDEVMEIAKEEEEYQKLSPEDKKKADAKRRDKI